MFPESSSFFLFLTVFNTQCCFLAVRFLSHKPVLRWTQVVRRPRIVDSFILNFVCTFVLERQSGGWPQQSAMYRPEERTEESELWLPYQCQWYSRRAIVHHTCGKPLLVERKSVSAALKFHIDPWQGGALVQKLHCQSGGVRGAVWKFKLGPQYPSTWRQTDVEVKFRTSCSYFSTTTTSQLAFIFRLFWDVA